MNDCVDILMAVYNGDKYLEEQIDSILNQTYSNFRLLISDDCSVDNSKIILEKYEKKDKRIKVFYQKTNLGYKKNFEFLCNHICSNYVMFSDQDDVWNIDKIEKMKKYIDYKNSALVFSDLELVDCELNSLNISLLNKIGVYFNAKNNNNFYLLKFENCVTGCALITRKSVIDKSLPFPNDFFPHDWWVGLIATQMGSVDFLDEKLVKYRQHNNNCIGLKYYNNTNKNFDDYYLERILYFRNEFTELYKNIKYFNVEYKKIIESGYIYFNDIKLKNISKLIVALKGSPLKLKIKYIIFFNFKFISKIIWKCIHLFKK